MKGIEKAQNNEKIQYLNAMFSTPEGRRQLNKVVKTSLNSQNFDVGTQIEKKLQSVAERNLGKIGKSLSDLSYALSKYFDSIGKPRNIPENFNKDWIKAIKDFQTENGLTPDGNVGNMTISKLKTYFSNPEIKINLQLPGTKTASKQNEEGYQILRDNGAEFKSA